MSVKLREAEFKNLRKERWPESAMCLDLGNSYHSHLLPAFLELSSVQVCRMH